jgi:hypothetical protein
MPSFEKVSFSLPEDLYEAISKAAQDQDQSRSQMVAELLRRGLSAGKQIDRLYRENARLTQALEETRGRLAAAEERLKHPPIDPSDFLTGAPPGTAKLRRDLEWSEEKRRQAEADAAEAQRNEQALRDEKEELEAIVGEQDEEIEALKEQCAKADHDCIEAHKRRGAAERDLDLEKARKVPWYWRLTLPDIRIHRVDVGYPAPHAGSWWRGFFACAFWFGFGLFATPHELPPMEYVASAAMGTWGDTQLAAARLHGGPFTGHETPLQQYALLRAGDNPKRLDQCIARAAKLGHGAKPIDCTIQVPSEWTLYRDIMTSGLNRDDARTKEKLEDRRRQLRCFERAVR